MRDFFMGAEVEVEELGLGDPAPEVTPPQGVIISRLEQDGWIRKYLYKSMSGGRPSEIMVGEVPPDPALGDSAPYGESDAPVRLDGFALMSGGRPQMAPGPIPISAHMEGRLNLPGQTSVPLVQQTPFLGQTPQAPPPPAAPAQQMISVPTGDAGLPPAEAVPPPPPAPALPDCDAPLQLPDGTVINPDEPVTLKELCAMLPYIAKYVEQQAKTDQGPAGLVRPNGAIPLSRQNYGSVPSFGPAGGPFAQGGGGGGGGGSTPGFGPVGVQNPAAPVGGPGQGNTGPQGPPGPPGVGNVIDGIQKTDGDFLNTGAMVIIPGTSKEVTIGGPVNGDGTTPVAISFSMELDSVVPAQIFDIFAGIDIDGTQYQLWRQSEQQGAGSDKVFRLSASGTLFVNLTPGMHTISICYGDNAGENPFTVVTAPGQPACWTAQHA